MLYLNYVNKLQKRGLRKKYIKELTGISIEPYREQRHKRMTTKQLDVCLNAAKLDRYGLLRILDKFPEHNPNEIYKHIKMCLQAFNANKVLKELILALIHDGVPISAINVLIKPLTNALPSYGMLAYLSRGIKHTRSELPFNQRQMLLIEIIKYIKHKGISQDYRGYFLLRTLFPEAESRVIASAIVKFIDHLVKSCTLCGSEFLTTSKRVLFCDKCRKKRRAV